MACERQEGQHPDDADDQQELVESEIVEHVVARPLPQACAGRAVEARLGQRAHARVGEQRRRGEVHHHALEPGLDVGRERQPRHLLARHFGQDCGTPEGIGIAAWAALRDTLPVARFHAVHAGLVRRAVGALGHQRKDPKRQVIADLRGQAERPVLDRVAQQHRRDRCRRPDREQQRGRERQAQAAPLHHRDDKDQRHRRHQQQADGVPGRKRQPAGEAGESGKTNRWTQQETRAREQHRREEEEEERVRQDLAAGDDQRHRQRRKNAGDKSDQRRDERAERGDERAGPGIDHRIDQRDRARNVAQRALDAGDQQGKERHSIRHEREIRPKRSGLGQQRAEVPIAARIRLRKERGVAPQ